MARSTGQIFEDHMGALARGDVPGIMADYADDAVLMAIDQVYVGKAEIQGFLEASFAAMPNARFEPKGLQVYGDAVLVSWSADSDTVRCSQGTDTLIIRDDMIRLQTVCFSVEPK